MKNIFSKTTENRTQNGVKSYLSPTFVLSPILIFAFLTLGVGQAWGAWTGNAGICVNGTWYKASDQIDGGNWLSGKTTINGTNLGAITSLTLGGQYDNYDNKQEDNCNWNSNNGIWITITTNSGTQINNFKLSCYRAGKSGDNNVWKTTGTIGNCGDGSSWATYSVNISDYAAGVYKLKVHWLSASGVALPSSGDDVATFTINPVVTFHANGGTGDDYTQTVTYNSATALTANTFSRTGYTFLGWATAADGDVVYADVASVTLTAHTDLYAQWAQPSLTITSHPTYLSTTDKLNLSIRYENIPEGYCFRVHELRTNGYYNNEAQGAYNPISGTGSTTYTSSAYLPTGDVDRIVVELWKIYPFEKQSVVSNEVAVTVEQEWRVDVKAKTDGLISTVGGTVSPASVSPTAHKGQTITAEANVGYKFTGWTANTPNITFENASEPSTTVYATASGEVYANYVLSNTPVDIFLPNTGNSWSTSDENWKFYKLPGEVGNTVTLAIDINKSDYSSSNYKLGFNIYHADWGDKWWHNKGNDDSYMDAHNCTDWGFNTKDGNYKTNLDLNVSGRYTFTLKNSNSSGSQKLSVTYPDKSFIEGDFPTAWSEDAYTLTENGDIQSVRINITTKGDKQFRLVSHGKLFGTSTKITAAANSQTLSAKKMTDEGAVMTLDAYVTGAYTFTYNKSSQNLTVTFPDAYRVTYGVGTGYTSPGRVSTSPNITSGDYVIAGTNITFTATPNLGYKFVGWYSDDACTGAAFDRCIIHDCIA